MSQGHTPLAGTFSLAGPTLSAEERSLFAEANPFGVILFKRNIEDRAQVQKLCDDVREAVQRDCPILIDQEGGRVQRMQPPEWPQYESMKALADDRERLKETIVALAKDLVEVGIDVNCVPVLDVLFPETHDAIGDRAFSDDVETVITCGKIVAETMLEYGITPVMKHMPGHGRAHLDTHKDLPRVKASADELQTDFAPFQALADTDYGDHIWGMAAHIIFEALDEDYPSSASGAVINAIRDHMGFDGLLLSDDLDMDALSPLGDIHERANAVLEAGCDIALYCHGEFKVMEKLADTLPPLRADSLERYERSTIRRRSAA